MVILSASGFVRLNPKIKFRELLVADPYTDQPVIIYEFFVFKPPMPFLKPEWRSSLISDEITVAFDHCKKMLPKRKPGFRDRIIRLLQKII